MLRCCNIVLHFRTDMMLRCCNIVLHFRTDMMLRCCNIVLHFRTDMMLRCCYIVLHFRTYVMLRCCNIVLHFRTDMMLRCCNIVLHFRTDMMLRCCNIVLHFRTDMMLRCCYIVLHFRTYTKEPFCVRTVPDATQSYVAPEKSNTSAAHIGRVNSMWKNGRERQLMSTRARLTMFGGWSKDPYLRLFIRKVLRIQPCSMARFGRTFGRGSGGGRTVPTKTCLSSLHKLWRPLREEKTSAPLGFLTFPLKSTRVLFKEIALSGKCKNTVICGKKSMTKNANVENVGSINNPPG